MGNPLPPREVASSASPLPGDGSWKEVARLFRQFSQQYGTEELLLNLGTRPCGGNAFPCSGGGIKGRIIEALQAQGFVRQMVEGDREELPLDFRFIDLLLRSADDPECNLSASAQGVRVGPGTRMPHCQRSTGRRDGRHSQNNNATL